MPFIRTASGLLVPVLGAGNKVLLNSPDNFIGPVPPTPTPTPPTPTPTPPTPTPTPTPPTPTPTAMGPLRVQTANARWFTRPDGEAVVLTGHHTWSNVMEWNPHDPPIPFDFPYYLNWFKQNGGNCMRLWRRETSLKQNDTSPVVPMPYARTGPGNALDGKPKFNLSQFNQAYFDRWASRVSACQAAGVYAIAMLHDAWGTIHSQEPTSPEGWWHHPFHQDNNINGIVGYPAGNVESQQVLSMADSDIVALQEAYWEKMVDTLNGYDNLIWETCNEPEAETNDRDFFYHLVSHVRAYEDTKPKQHLILFSAFAPWSSGYNNSALDASSADALSPMVDPDNPAINNTSRPWIIDSDHIYGVGGSAGFVWRCFTRGHSVIMMDSMWDVSGQVGLSEIYWPPDTVSGQQSARLGSRSVRAAISLAGGTVTGFVPGTESSTGYCLRKQNVAYLLFKEGGAGSLSVNFNAVPSNITFSVSYMDVSSGGTIVVDGGTISGGATRALNAPFATTAVILLAAVTSPTPTPTPTPPTPTPTPTPPGTVGPGRDDLLFDLHLRKNNWPCVNDQFEWLTAQREWEYCYSHPNEGFAGIRWQPTWMRIDGYEGSWHPAEGEIHRIYRKGASGQDAQTLVLVCGPNPAAIPAGDKVVIWETEDWNGGVKHTNTFNLSGYNLPLRSKMTVVRSTGSEPWDQQGRRIVEIDCGTALPAIDHEVGFSEWRTRMRMRHWSFYADSSTKEARHPIGWFQWITKNDILANGGYVMLGGQQGQPTWRDWSTEYVDFGGSLIEELWRMECRGMAEMFGDTDPRRCCVELENEPVIDEYYDLLPDVWYAIARQEWGNDRTLMVKAASFGGTDHLRDRFNFTNPVGHNTILGAHIYPGQQHYENGPAIDFWEKGATDYVTQVVANKRAQLGYKMGGGFTEIGVYNFEWYDYDIKHSQAEIGRRYGRFLTSCAERNLSMWAWGFVGGDLHSADIRMVDGHMIETWQEGMAPYTRRAFITTT